MVSQHPAGLVAYHGLGYVGLTGALHFAQKGVQVIGYDPSQSVVDSINAGAPHADHFLDYLRFGMPDYRTKFRATTDWEETLTADVHVLAVPTEKNDEPWMELVIAATTRILEALVERGDQDRPVLIIIESTLTPGTIDRMLAYPIAARMHELGTIGLAHAPRRDWFASRDKNLATVKRVIGGINTRSTEWAYAWLAPLMENATRDLLTTDHRTAELVKPLENALFHLPIMLGHEVATRYPEADVTEALRLAVTHWRFESFGGLYVGLGSGGRCVPMGPKYLIAGAEPCVNPRQDGLLERSLEVEQDITDTVLTAIVDHLFEMCGSGDNNRWVDLTGSVLILGLGYRPDFDDFGFSPGLRLAKRLNIATPKVEVYVHDSVASDDATDRAIEGTGIYCRYVIEWSCPPQHGPYYGPKYDVIVLATPHAAYETIPVHLMKPGTLVLDARGTWAAWAESTQAKELDVIYRQVGRPGWRG